MAKKRVGSQIGNWLPTTKSQESLWFPCVQVACQIQLQSSRRRLQLCFRTNFNWRSSHKGMGFQSCGSPNFGGSHLGVPGQNDIWVLAPWPCTKYTIRGKEGDGFPSSGHNESCESVFARGSSVHQRCSSTALTNFVWFVQVHVSNWFACQYA
jgi:hypothetical protein